ncbi:hypothetical protein LXL04_034615 [Taraxacum kok-saghyz]
MLMDLLRTGMASLYWDKLQCIDAVTSKHITTSKLGLSFEDFSNDFAALRDKSSALRGLSPEDIKSRACLSRYGPRSGFFSQATVNPYAISSCSMISTSFISSPIAETSVNPHAISSCWIPELATPKILVSPKSCFPSHLEDSRSPNAKNSIKPLTISSHILGSCLSSLSLSKNPNSEFLFLFLLIWIGYEEFQFLREVFSSVSSTSYSFEISRRFLRQYKGYRLSMRNYWSQFHEYLQEQELDVDEREVNNMASTDKNNVEAQAFFLDLDMDFEAMSKHMQIEESWIVEREMDQYLMFYLGRENDDKKFSLDDASCS